MRHVLITGASDGIGRALTDIYGETDWQVWATGRRAREEVVPPLPGTVQYVAADLTGEHALADALPPKLDLAILNAGAGKVAPLAEHTDADLSAMVALNVTAPLLLAQALSPRLEGGTLCFIGSTAARGRHRDFAPYAATKAALAGAARSLAIEWAGRVNVMILHPGPTATGMHDKAGLPQIAARRFFTPPRIVARDLARAIAQGKERRFGIGYTLRHAFGNRAA